MEKIRLGREISGGGKKKPQQLIRLKERRCQPCDEAGFRRGGFWQEPTEEQGGKGPPLPPRGGRWWEMVVGAEGRAGAPAFAAALTSEAWDQCGMGTGTGWGGRGKRRTVKSILSLRELLRKPSILKKGEGRDPYVQCSRHPIDKTMRALTVLRLCSRKIGISWARCGYLQL